MYEYHTYVSKHNIRNIPVLYTYDQANIGISIGRPVADSIGHQTPSNANTVSV